MMGYQSSDKYDKLDNFSLIREQNNSFMRKHSNMRNGDADRNR